MIDLYQDVTDRIVTAIEAGTPPWVKPWSVSDFRPRNATTQVEGMRLSQIHPVLDARNKPIERPSAFYINTSIQRCLVKASALHGLGLYIYAGEDLPESAANESQPQQPAAEMVNAAQIARINSLLAESGQTLQRLLAFLHVDAFEQIPVSEFPRVEQLLERSKRKVA